MKKFLLLFLLTLIACKPPEASEKAILRNEPETRIMFWNSENLFDCFNDTLKNDDEFLPYGIRGWNSERYNLKLEHMYKVFIAAGFWNPPDIIGLCEVENKNVLFGLLKSTPFSFYNYRFIHHDSPDRRGIDVAMLYNPEKISLIHEEAFMVSSSDKNFKTRDILYARLRINKKDTLSLFINHWPSKYGGSGVTNEIREEVAEFLATKIVNLRDTLPNEKIIITGDFNDPPGSSSIKNLELINDRAGQPVLKNLCEDFRGEIQGSYKFEGSWEFIDQMIVSRNFMDAGERLFVIPGSFSPFTAGFLLEKDIQYGGMKPFRTYAGMTYSAGYSDHLPILLDLFSSN